MEKILVGILWFSPNYDPVRDGDSPTVHFLTGSEGVREFERDRYDSRVDLGRDRAKDGPIPFFESAVEAFAWLGKNPGQQCQIPAWKARELAK